MYRARRALLLVQGIAALLVTGSVGVRAAHACGGFFCNRPPPDNSLPIAQAAENVLFVMDRDPATGASRVEAHIQILYTGPATQFSWIVPVTAVPTVDVGWDILFDRLEPPTRPSFRLSLQQQGRCQGQSDGDVSCGGGEKAAPASSGAGGGPGMDPSVDVVSRGSAGPYDYVVVRSEDGATLRTWLTNNGYYVSDDSARIVDEYVAGGHSFVAVKLQVGQDTSAIRPIILRLASAEACLPLKLTAIAATPDLRINVWVLATARAIPINYVEIAINQAKLDWFQGGRNYDQLLQEAANEAQGNAFAVEYAQPSANATTWFTIQSGGQRESLPILGDPPTYLSSLFGIGVRPIGAVLQILRKYIPMPASLAAQGVSETSFYGNNQLYWNRNRVEFAPFDPAALTAALEAEVLQPIDMFRTVFERNAYLTRLATFISPEEMTKDPLFVTNHLLPDVNPQHVATGIVWCGDEEFAYCSAPVEIMMEDGRTILYGGGACRGTTTAPEDVNAMPSADVAWNRDPDSEGQIVLDNRAAISEALKAHNATVAMPGSGCGCALRARPRGLAMIGLAGAALALLVRRRRRT
jgi:hypothetical protein